MEYTTTIRAELEDFLKREGTTLHHFAETSGVNAGTLSGILSGNRPIAMGQLDRITAAMGLPEGHFFNLYVTEFVALDANPHWRRIRAFLLRCAELGRHDCICELVTVLIDDLKQIPDIFDTAELMLESGRSDAAVILYEYVIQSERFSHSERLAMSYYRLFQIYQKNPQKSFTAAIQFIPYRNRLPEAYALDGLIMLMELYFVNKEWSKLEDYANELIDLATALYSNRQWKDPDFRPVRPLVYYYGIGYLYKAGSFEKRRMFAESRRWIAEYADLSWFEGLDDQGMTEVERYKMFATANLLQIDIEDGNQVRIPEYVSFLRKHPSEILEGLITLLESANRHKFFIDEYLHKFADEIKYYSRTDQEGWSNQRSGEVVYKQTVHTFQSSLLFQKYAIYCFRRNQLKKGLTHTLHSFKFSIQINSKNHMVSSMTLFELYRNFTTKRQRVIYNKLCRGVWDYEEELSTDSIINAID
ncbi:transcriptional regulator with XRE-family HTH domain [Paenibacillus anaericanus]|uniref:helix-turn-helix domain-containing protein n=1 Tax=Paenibacillus anaericanus TaxID=170367 RepID=UPI0027862FFB|nr:helix-turn-helix transcriptional regulator [Paenibacillus anaericanus]MDQ0089442.1 transcriptional regulator with XRE-family HTH domain [Paenibacillus anaericanus]